MRIALVSTGLSLGGAETQLARLATALNKTDEVLVISLTHGGELAEQLKNVGVRVRHLHATNTRNTVQRLRRTLDQFKPDIVHSFLWHANIATRLACIRRKAILINSYRGKEPSKGRDVIERATRFLADNYTTNSQYIADFFKLPKNRTTVIRNGVPATFWKGYEYTPKKKQAIMVGQLRREKDYRTYIDTARRLPDWKFLIVGKGPREQELKIYARQVPNVEFLGQRTDVAKLLSTSTCLVHLSFTEGSPNTVIEAMLLGVPVIASDIPALHELVAKRGVLVPEKNARAVAQALKKQTGKQARETKQWARKTFSMERMVQEHRELYKTVYEHKTRA